MIANENPVIADSLWTATANPTPDCPPLAGAVQADVVIIGGGFTGLSAALHLAEAGKSVVVLEAETPGWGASGSPGGGASGAPGWGASGSPGCGRPSGPGAACCRGRTGRARVSGSTAGQLLVY